MSVWLTLTYERGIRHGRMGYRGVYGRVACPCLQAVLRGKEMNSTEVRLHYARWDINE